MNAIALVCMGLLNHSCKKRKKDNLGSHGLTNMSLHELVLDKKKRYKTENKRLNQYGKAVEEKCGIHCHEEMRVPQHAAHAASMFY